MDGRLDAAHQLRLGDSRCRLHVDLADLAGLAEHSFGGGRVERGDGRAERAVRAAPGRDAGDGVGGRRKLGEDGDLVADLEVPDVGGVLVDHHLGAGARRLSAGQQTQRVERDDVGPGRTERGRAVGSRADRLAVAPDELGVALGIEGDRLHAGHLGHRGRQAGVDPLPLADEVGAGVERLGGPDHGRGPRVDLVVEPVERRVDGVGEDERAGDERDAEQHGQCGQRVTQPVRHDALSR